MADETACPRCGARGTATGPAGECAACLLSLALLEPDVALDDEAGGDAILPESAYRVVTVLGADSSGTTYLAEDEDTGRLVTLDVVTLDPERGQAFHERATVLRALAHASLQTVLDARTTPAGDACVVAAYVNGPRIDRYCRGARVDGASRAHLFAAVCDAVAHAHAAGVCHGRLGPDMVVVQSGKDGAATPIVIGYRASCDPLRAAGADLVGLEAIARAIGWSAEPGPGLTSIDALRNAVCEALSRARFV